MSRSINNDNKSWTPFNIFVVLLFCLLLYIFVPQIYKSGEKISKLRAEIERLDERIVSDEKRLEELKNNINMLEDPYFKEKLVRKRLRMVKDGEVIYKLLEEEK
ncbi:FtsB family cell division protein [Fusobacterium sp. PH5-44]|uniref:FtsB family cell division protein n=1 Tax=unclassified Fusobacterium TaxID=2648384 RepID=UPI003D19C5B0